MAKVFIQLTAIDVDKDGNALEDTLLLDLDSITSITPNNIENTSTDITVDVGETITVNNPFPVVVSKILKAGAVTVN